tara:strand:+ start:322 stop:891 length:570 start_codon:yes stop_codon:yes gene_type:complete
MINSYVIIFKLKSLFDVLYEIRENNSFKIIYTPDLKDLIKLKEINSNHVLICDKKPNIDNKLNLLILKNYPFKMNVFLDKINILLLKNKYSHQEKFKLNNYTLDINSRELIKLPKKLKLTQKETEIILFLKNTSKPQTINELQKEVWGHTFDLETHTVETHIYRLRKKVSEIFKDKDFIKSESHGYKIS